MYIVYIISGCSQNIDSYNLYSQFNNGIEPIDASIDDFIYENNNGIITINKYIGEKENVIVPSTINGYPVKIIGKSAFASGYELIPGSEDEYIKKYGNAVNICVSEGVEKLEDYSFSSPAIESVVLPSTIRMIGDGCFCESNIESLYIPSNEPVIIGKKAFSLCKELNKIDVNRIEKWDWSAIYYCEKLEHITGINESTKITGEDPLYTDILCECRHLDSSEYNGWWYRIIGNEACITDYSGDKTEIEVPTEINGYKVTQIGKSAFGKFISEDNISEICRQFTNIVIPDSVEVIGAYAFDCCMELEDVVLPNALKKIGKGAFRGCNKLNEIYLPADITLDGDLFIWSETAQKIKVVYQ